MSVLHWLDLHCSMHRALVLLSSHGAGCTLPCSGAHLLVRWQNCYFMYVSTFFFFIQGEGGKGRAVLKSIRKAISYHEMEGTGGVCEHSAGFDTCRMVWCTGKRIWWDPILPKTLRLALFRNTPKICFRWMSSFAPKMSPWVKKKMVELSINLVYIYSFPLISRHPHCRADVHMGTNED